MTIEKKIPNRRKCPSFLPHPVDYTIKHHAYNRMIALIKAIY